MRSSSIKSVVLAAAAVSALAAAAQAELAYGITGTAAGGSLVSFDTATPGTVNTVGSLSGIVAGHAVRAIDFRPANGQLYALSTSGTAFQVYTVDLASAALTPVGAGGNVSFTWPSRVSMDFNPAADRIRVVGSGAQNLRLNPITGALVLEDTNLAYVAGDPNAVGNPPFPVGVAYDNNDNNPLTPTTMYVYDFDNDVLSRSGSVGGSPVSPNTGQLTTIGAAAPGFLTNDGGVGFDVSGVTGTAFVSYQDFTTFSETLGTINLATGSVSPIGAFGTGLDVLDISVTVPEPTTLALAGLAAFGLLRRRA